MKRIEMPQGYFALVDDEDYDEINKYRWKPLKTKRNVYACRNSWNSFERKYETVLMHRVISNARRGEQVDHINHHTLDNRKENLRVCDQTHNNANSMGRVMSRASQYKGVSLWAYGGNHYWMARVKKNKKVVHCSYHKTEESAARAYDKAAVEWYGEFACPNF